MANDKTQPPSIQVDKSSSQSVSGGVDSTGETTPLLGLSGGNGQFLPPLDAAFGSASSPAPLTDDPSLGVLPAFGTTLDTSNYDFIAGAYDNNPAVGNSASGPLSSGGNPGITDFGVITNNLEGAPSDPGSPFDDLPFAPPVSSDFPGTFIGAPVNGGGGLSLGGILPITVPETGSDGADSSGFSFNGVFPDVDQIGDIDSSNDGVSMDGTGPDLSQPQGAAASSDASYSSVSGFLGEGSPSSIISSGPSPGQDLGGSSGLGGLGSALSGSSGIPSLGGAATLDSGDSTQDVGQVLGEGGLDGIPYFGSVIPDQSGGDSSVDGVTRILSGGGNGIISDPTSVESIEGPTVPDNEALGDFSGGGEFTPIKDSHIDGGIPFSGSTSIESSNLSGTPGSGGLPYLGDSASVQGVESGVDPGSKNLGNLFGGGSGSFGITGIAGAVPPGLPDPASGIQKLAPFTPTDNGFTATPPAADYSSAGYQPANSPLGNARGGQATSPNAAPGGSSPVGYAPFGYSPLGLSIAALPYGYAPLGYAPLEVPSSGLFPPQDSQASDGNPPNPVQPPAAPPPVGYQTSNTGLPVGYSPFVGYTPVGTYPASGFGGYPWGGAGYPVLGFPGSFPSPGAPNYNADASKSSSFRFSSTGSFPGFTYSNTQAAQASTDPSTNQPIFGQAPTQASSPPPPGSYPVYLPVQGSYGYSGGWYVDGNGELAYNPGPTYSSSPIPGAVPDTASSSSSSSFSAVLQELQNQFNQALVNAQAQSGNLASPDSLGREIPISGLSSDSNNVEGESLAPLNQLD